MTIFVLELQADEVGYTCLSNLEIYKLEFWKEVTFIKLLLGFEE